MYKLDAAATLARVEEWFGLGTFASTYAASVTLFRSLWILLGELFNGWSTS